MGSWNSDRNPQGSLEDDLSKLYLRFSPEENKIRGFAGKWTFYSPTPDDVEDEITSQFRCLRTYAIVPNGEDKNIVKFQTFNEFEPANGKAKKREIDGIYESSYLRSAADLFFSNNTALSDSEKREDYPDCVYWRSAALDSENVMRIAPHLPPKPLKPEEQQDSRYAKWFANNGAAGVFAFEAFIMDGQNRWSMGALYSLRDLKLISHFCIQERLTTVDPSKALDFDKFEYRQLAPRLPADPRSWSNAMEFRGEMTELIWDEDGEALKLPPRPASFTPPTAHSEEHRLFTYEDGCYAYYPAILPATEIESGRQFDEGARFEMGLAHTDAQGMQTFRRLILRYSGTGAAVSLTKEHFKAEGSFEFDRRQSQSVRRSMGSRRAGSMRNIDPGSHPQYPRSADQRAAKLKEAFRRAESDGPNISEEATPLPRMNSGGNDTLDEIQYTNAPRDSGNRA